MAHGIVLAIMSLSLVTSILSIRSLLIDWRKSHRQMYGTMNFDGHATRGSSKLALVGNLVICLVSILLLVSSMMIYQFIRFPVL